MSKLPAVIVIGVSELTPLAVNEIRSGVLAGATVTVTVFVGNICPLYAPIHPLSVYVRATATEVLEFDPIESDCEPPRYEAVPLQSPAELDAVQLVDAAKVVVHTSVADPPAEDIVYIG